MRGGGGGGGGGGLEQARRVRRPPPPFFSRAQHCVELSDDFRQLGMDHKHEEDVLQARGMAMLAFVTAQLESGFV